MTVVEKKTVPIYEVICCECHSKIEYKKSEVSYCHIICPVCGMSNWADTTIPVRREWEETVGLNGTREGLSETFHSIDEITSDRPITGVKIKDEKVFDVNPESSWEVDKILTDYIPKKKPHEVLIAVSKRKAVSDETGD